MDLSAHMRYHTGERPFACSVCPKKFINATRLRDHCRMHTGEKPFECAMCTQKFATKAHLVKHIKIHETKKKVDKRKMVLVKSIEYGRPIIVTDKFIISTESDEIGVITAEQNITQNEMVQTNEVKNQFEVTVQDDADVNTKVLVVNNTKDNLEHQNKDTGDGVAYMNSDVSFAGNVKLVTTNQEEMNIASIAAPILEGTALKLYQVDQSLVQIHSSAGQVTISKITSKMTANF